MESSPRARFLSRLVPVAAVAALGALVVLFAWLAVSFARSVVAWAQRDLDARAELAAATLAEPLATQDFRQLRSFADDCRGKGLRLTVTTATGGRFFDSAAEPLGKGDYTATRDCGEFRVTLGLSRARVLEPLRRAVPVFAIAALVGAASVLLFMLTLYRQRVRIRELKKLEHFRADFIADVSHEFKTPLTGILGAADLLGDAQLPEEQRATLLGLVRREATRLNALAQSVMTLARLENEEQILKREETAIVPLVEEAVGRFRAAAEAQGVALSFSAGRLSRDETFSCDPRLVLEAVSNLIGNALRHSGSSDVAVSLSRAGGVFRIAVEDHGIGIPSAETARVFERFHRVDPARAAETGGAGLGLAIVRRIARLHGGTVSLESSVPHGCRFTLGLPVAKVSPSRKV